MQDFVVEIYKYAELIEGVEELIEDCYLDRGDYIKLKWDEISKKLFEYCSVLTEKDINVAKKLLNILKNCSDCMMNSAYGISEFGDNLKAVDEILYETARINGEVDVAEGRYRIYSSKSGYFTMQNIDSGRRLHSEINPAYEAYTLSKDIFTPKTDVYAFLGCGLGYLPWKIYELSDESAEIYIYHTDATIVDYAVNYGVLSYIPEDRLHIFTGDDDEELIEMFLDDSSYNGYKNIKRYVFPYVKDIISEESYDGIRGLLSNGYTERFHRRLDGINSYQNHLNCDHMFNEYKLSKNNDEWIFVGGGPSLDECVDFIRKNQDKKNIICASTVAKRLTDLGIVPDMICVLDPKKGTFKHLENYTHCEVPLFISTSANWRFGRLYKGDKYLVRSATDEGVNVSDISEGCAFNLGTTVSTMALVLALKLGAKRIDVIGLDLSYPTGKTHAEGLSHTSEIDERGMVLIRSNDGGKVLTSNEFLLYIREIEALVKRHPEVEFINFAKHGAKIDGMKIS